VARATAIFYVKLQVKEAYGCVKFVSLHTGTSKGKDARMCLLNLPYLSVFPEVTV